MTSNTILFPILTVIGIMPVFFLVAAVMRRSLKRAKEITLKFLEDWANQAPVGLRGAISSILGFAGGFALLVALTFAFNRIGDATMPFISKQVRHFNYSLVASSVEHPKDWKNFRNEYRVEWEKENPGKKWKDHKIEDLEKWHVKIARILFYYSLLLVAAGGFDIFSRRYRKRGLVLLVVGIIATSACLLCWADRKESYIDEILTLNQKLEKPVPRPKSLSE
jgi:hypothetical protein